MPSLSRRFHLTSPPLLLVLVLWAGLTACDPGTPESASVPRLVEGRWRGSLELTDGAVGEAPMALDLEAGPDRRLTGVVALGRGTGDLAPLSGLEASVTEGISGEEGLFFHAVRPLPTGRVRLEVSATVVDGRLTGDVGLRVLSSRGETDLTGRLDATPVAP